MSYVDGYVLSVKKSNLNAYKKMAQQGGKIWMKHGAVAYVEAVGDDLNSKWCKFKFPKMAKAKPNEVVLFSFIIFKSKAHRNQVNAKVMADPHLDSMKDKPMPFDMNKMAFGGFKPIVDL